ncbi:MAG: YciI family protein [Cytophagales bacterium]|nr:YciI family protein [Cytophagales bacterium]
MDAEKYNRAITLLCPTCGSSQFSHSEESALFTCTSCGRETTRDELIRESGENQQTRSQTDQITMLFAIIFTDKLGYEEVRARHLQAHINWLEQNKELVPVGGSLRHEIGETPIGGLWIAEAESKEQLENLIRSDPFFIAGLRESYEIFHWSKANAQRKVLV